MDEIDSETKLLAGPAHGDTNAVPPAQPKATRKARKFKKAPGAPKRFRSAFIFFSQHKHKEIQETLAKNGGSEKTTSVAKMVSEAWRSLDSDDRSKWETKAAEDKERFEKEKATYRGPWTVPIGHRKSKDPSAPKRPASAFLAFSNSRRAAVKKDHMESTNAEISRTLSKMWKEAPEDIRKEYCEAEAIKREEYKIKIADWRLNNEEESRKKARIEEVQESAGVNAEQASARAAAAESAYRQQASGANSLPRIDPPPTMQERVDSSSVHRGNQLTLEQLASAGRLAEESERMQSLINHTLPAIGEFASSRDNPLAWAAGASSNLGARTNSLESSIAAALREGRAGLQNQSDALGRQRQLGMTGIESLIASSSMPNPSQASSQYGAEMLRDQAQGPNLSIQQHLRRASMRRDDFAVQPSIFARQDPGILQLQYPHSTDFSVGIPNLLNSGLRSNANQLSNQEQNQSLLLNLLAASANPDLLAQQARMLPNNPLETLLLQRSLAQQQGLQGLQPFFGMHLANLAQNRQQQPPPNQYQREKKESKQQ